MIVLAKGGLILISVFIAVLLSHESPAAPARTSRQRTPSSRSKTSNHSRQSASRGNRTADQSQRESDFFVPSLVQENGHLFWKTGPNTKNFIYLSERDNSVKIFSDGELIDAPPGAVNQLTNLYRMWAYTAGTNLPNRIAKFLGIPTPGRSFSAAEPPIEAIPLGSVEEKHKPSGEGSHSLNRPIARAGELTVARLDCHLYEKILCGNEERKAERYNRHIKFKQNSLEKALSKSGLSHSELKQTGNFNREGIQKYAQSLRTELSIQDFSEAVRKAKIFLAQAISDSPEIPAEIQQAMILKIPLIKVVSALDDLQIPSDENIKKVKSICGEDFTRLNARHLPTENTVKVCPMFEAMERWALVETLAHEMSKSLYIERAYEKFLSCYADNVKAAHPEHAPAPLSDLDKTDAVSDYWGTRVFNIVTAKLDPGEKLKQAQDSTFLYCLGKTNPQLRVSDKDRLRMWWYQKDSLENFGCQPSEQHPHPGCGLAGPTF